MFNPLKHNYSYYKKFCFYKTATCFGQLRQPSGKDITICKGSLYFVHFLFFLE